MSAHLCVHAGEVDDTAPSLFYHPRHEGAAEMKCGRKIDVNHPVPVDLRSLQEVTTVLEASQASFVRLAGLSLFDMMR